MDIYKIRQKIRNERLSIEELPLKVTFYARVSTTSDTQLNSIENQKKYFIDKITKNPNWTYVEGYYDEIRGESAKNRTAFMQMIKDSSLNKFDLILTKEISRFARDTIDSLDYTRKLLNQGVCVWFENDNLNTIDADSELRLTIMSSIAQEEVRKLSERIKFGQYRSIMDGKVLGNNNIYGYDKKNCRLTVNEEEAVIVKKVFEYYAIDKMSLRGVSVRLAQEGYFNRVGKEFSHHTLTNIIKNPKYKGYYCGNKVKIVDYKTSKQYFLPEKDWVMYKDEDRVPAIVAEEIWDLANKRLKDRSYKLDARKDGNGNVKHLYTRKVYCGFDGKPYWKSSYNWQKRNKQTKPQWKCSGKREKNITDPSLKCPSFPIFEYELNNIVKVAMKKIFTTDTSIFDEFFKVLQAASDNNNNQKQITNYQNEIKKLKTKKERLLELNIDGYISKEEFGERNLKLNEDIYLIEKNIETIKQKKEKIFEKTKFINEIKKILNDTSIDIESDDFIKFAVSNIIDKIIITPKDKDENNNQIADIDIILQGGYKVQETYNRTCRCFGNTTLMMLPKHLQNNRVLIQGFYKMQITNRHKLKHLETRIVNIYLLI